MIDLHNHLLYGVDDGSKSLNESIDVLRDMFNNGYTDVILTPHYIKDSIFNSNRKNNLSKMKIIKKELDKNKIGIKLYLGNEIYINDDILELLDSKEISSLNNSKYLLIELPMTGEYAEYDELFMDLIENGYSVVLAHPERYYTFQKDFNLIRELNDLGVYFQCNIDSILGKYGTHAEAVIKKMLKEKLVTFLATDIHYKKRDCNEWQKAFDKMLKYVSHDELDMLLEGNAKKYLLKK